MDGVRRESCTFLSFLRTRGLKTAVLVYSWICLGYYSECLGPSLPTLKQQVNATTEEISRVMSARSAGLFVGSALGGILHDRFNENRALIIGCAILFASFMFIATVICRVLWLLGIVLFLSGTCHGLHTTGANPLLVDVWREKSAGPLNLLHAGYGIGGAMAPFVIKSFVIGGPDSASYSGRAPPASNGTEPLSRINLFPSYAIMSGLCILSALSYIAVWAAGRGDRPGTDSADSAAAAKESKLKQFVRQLRSSRRNCVLIGALLASVFFFYFLIVGGDRVHSRFIFLYARESDLKFSREQAFLINSFYWIWFTVSRLTAALVLLWVSAELVLAVEVVGCTVAAGLMILLPSTAVSFWATSSAFSFFKSPTFPTGLGVLNRYIEVTGILTLNINCGCAVGAIIMQWLVGYSFDVSGPRVVLYSNLIHSIALVAVGVLMVAIGRMKGSRFSAGDESAAAAAAMVEENGDLLNKEEDLKTAKRTSCEMTELQPNGRDEATC